MKEIKELHERFYDEIADVKEYAKMAETYPDNHHEYMHLARQELQHAHEMFELIMRHADKKDVHKEASFQCMKHSMQKAFDEAKEELE